VIGYLHPLSSILYPDERLFVSSSYCAFCQNLKKRKNNLARLFLSNDIIFFYSLFASCLNNFTFHVYPFYCYATMSNRFLIKDNGLLDYFTDFTLLFTSLKFYDNYIDSKFPKSFISNLIFKFFFNSIKYINKNLSVENNDFFNSKTKKIFLLNNKCNKSSVNLEDEMLQLQSLFETILPLDLLPYSAKLQVSSIVSQTIRLLYIIDSIDDFENDLKKNKDNLILNYMDTPASQKDLQKKNSRDFVDFKLKDNRDVINKIEKMSTLSLNYCISQLENLRVYRFKHLLKHYFSDLIPLQLDRALNKNNIASRFIKS